MHLVYVATQLEVGVVSGEQGGAGRENDDMQQERRKSHTIGSLQRTISSSPRYSFPPSDRLMMLCL